MRRCTLIAVTTLALLPGTPAEAQRRAPRHVAFGFSGVTYLFEASDGVFTDADEHLPGAFGFRLSVASFGDRSWGWMLDGELYLGVANRQLLDADMPNTIVGLQGFVGPVVALGSIQLYALGGVNRTTVGESKVVEVPGLVVIRYVGTGGLSDLWAARLNALGQSSGEADVVASIPRYEEVSPAAALGMAWDIGGRGAGFRLSFDYLPVFLGPTRNNFRVTVSLAG